MPSLSLIATHISRSRSRYLFIGLAGIAVLLVLAVAGRTAKDSAENPSPIPSRAENLSLDTPATDFSASESILDVPKSSEWQRSNQPNAPDPYTDWQLMDSSAPSDMLKHKRSVPAAAASSESSGPSVPDLFLEIPDAPLEIPETAPLTVTAGDEPSMGEQTNPINSPINSVLNVEPGPSAPTTLPSQPSVEISRPKILNR